MNVELVGFLGILLAAIAMKLLRGPLDKMAEEIARYLIALISGRERWLLRRVPRAMRVQVRPFPRLRIPSLSLGLVALAVRRLPDEMHTADKKRWEQEMRADVCSQPRRRRLRVAFNAWRRGAPNMPVGRDAAPRSVRD